MIKRIRSISAVLTVVFFAALAPSAITFGAMPGIDPSKGIDGSVEGLDKAGVPTAPVSDEVIDSSGNIEPCDEPAMINTKHGAPVDIGITPATRFGSGLCAVSGALPYVDPDTNRTMVPLRDLMENIGAVVTWDQERKTAVVERDGTRIEMQVGSTQPTVNGQMKEIDAPAVMYPDEWRVFVPLRFVTETLGAKVDWIPKNLGTITINGTQWDIGTVEIVFPN